MRICRVMATDMQGYGCQYAGLWIWIRRFMILDMHSCERGYAGLWMRICRVIKVDFQGNWHVYVVIWKWICSVMDMDPHGYDILPEINQPTKCGDDQSSPGPCSWSSSVTKWSYVMQPSSTASFSDTKVSCCPADFSKDCTLLASSLPHRPFLS